MSVLEREKPLLLIVDDNSANIQLLSNIISTQNYDIAIATNGYKALEIANSYLPDLILLDISMPGIDGFEVCTRLKNEPITADIPVIYLTCFTGQSEIVRGFETGGVDYITKPYHIPELLARVRTHLDLKFLRERVEKDKIALEKMNTQLTEFHAIAIHDLKVPLNNISLLGKMIRDDKDMDREEIEEFTEDIITSAIRMYELIVDLLSISAAEEGKVKVNFETCNIANLMDEVYSSFKDTAAEKNISLIWEKPENPMIGYLDRKLFFHIQENLISNSIKFTEPNKKVELLIREEPEHIIVTVKDEGPGFTEEDRQNMYKSFQRLSAQPTADEASSGLGLSIVKLYVESIKSEISLDSEVGVGSEFHLKIPKNPTEV